MLGSSSRRVVVVGAGVMGLWTALLARRDGWDVTLLDAWGVGNPRATSSDATRVTRAGHGPDELYVRWSRRALEAWKALGAETGQPLFVQAGVLWLARRDDGFEAASEVTLRRLGVPVEHLSADEIGSRWPVISSDGLAFAMLEPEAGALLARAGIHAAFETFTVAGGRFDVAAARPGAEGGDRLDAVRSDDGREWPADAFVFACGPWLGRLFPDVVGEILRVTKQDVVYLGTPAGDARYRAEALPVWSEFDAPFYGIPTIDGGAFKVARDGYGPLFDPTDGERLISPESLAAVRDQLQRRFPRLADAPVVESRVCQYESTADTHFIIDRHPGWSNAWIVGGGSGHAFKHGPSIGGYVVGLLAGRTPEELEGTDAMRFRLGRRSPGLGMRAGHTPELAVAATR